jgi:DNA-binding CsgD family transcriptional regulator
MLVATARGEWSVARRWLARSEALVGRRSRGAEWLGYAVALMRESDGDLSGAADGLETVAGRIVATGVPVLLLNIGADTVRLALATRRPRLAEDVTAAIVALAGRTRSPFARGVATWTAGLLSGDHRRVSCAAETLASCQRRADAARARHDAAVLAAKAHDEGAARQLARDAFATYDALGAEHLHARLRSELRAEGIPLRPRRTPARASHGWDSLTPSERTIVTMVGQGLTNTEIAERLYVSRRTVESHLGRVYPKLDVSTRAQLVASAGRRQPRPG